MTSPHPSDTIVALSSAAGIGARAVVRISGPKTRSILQTLFTPASADEPPKPGRVSPGSLRLTGVHSPLPADAYLFLAPKSYTGQDLAELHTFSSPPLIEQLIADALNLGARPAQPGEFTLRAFLAGKKDLTQSEAVLAVIEAGTDADLQSALAQLAGGVSAPLSAMREDLLNLVADIEAALDFVDEDIEFVSQADTLKRIAAGMAQLVNIKRQLDTRTVSGRALRVALIGEPNAGKSSLFNALVGDGNALVSEEAGTTRDYLSRQVPWEGIPVEFIDTAGKQEATDTIEEQSQSLGREQAEGADLVLHCVPVIQGERHGVSVPVLQDNYTGELTLRRSPVAVESLLFVRTMSDLRPNFVPTPDEIACSVKAPGGLTALRQALTERLQQLTRAPLAPSQSRCRHHVDAAIQRLQEAHRHALFEDPPELLALAVRSALDEIGAMTGAVYTNDLLDRIFSRFCIGK